MKTIFRMLLFVFLSLLLCLVGTGVLLRLLHPAFGALPKGKDLERVQASPHYHNGAFHNDESTAPFLRDMPSQPEKGSRAKTLRKHLIKALRQQKADTTQPSAPQWPQLWDQALPIDPTLFQPSSTEETHTTKAAPKPVAPTSSSSSSASSSASSSITTTTTTTTTSAALGSATSTATTAAPGIAHPNLGTPIATTATAALGTATSTATTAAPGTAHPNLGTPTASIATSASKTVAPTSSSSAPITTPTPTSPSAPSTTPTSSASISTVPNSTPAPSTSKPSTQRQSTSGPSPQLQSPNPQAQGSDFFLWLGHSSYLLRLDGRTLLVDPVLTRSFPAGLVLSPLKGTDLYRPEDLPPIDYLLITHDHWDHLDWGTLKALRNTVGKVLCPLGVGAHLRRWGYSRNQIVELDWNEQYAEASLHITCLPARHFSGRLLKRNTSLWASFMVQGGKTVYVGGDSGFGKHYAHIAQRFPHIDLAIVENGQYNPVWAHIHTFPHELVEVVRLLRPGLAVPVHNSKYVMAPHAPDEPRDLLRQALTADPKLPLVFPTPGHALYF